MSNVLIFKTNIKTEEDLVTISSLLNRHTSINSWNVDTEDIDCVLRVVSDKITCGEIIEQINEIGYHCSELE
jgi:hypothetical protein